MKMTSYTSVIRINGIPILPPLITEKRRLEIARDKADAVRVEQKLRHFRQENPGKKSKEIASVKQNSQPSPREEAPSTSAETESTEIDKYLNGSAGNDKQDDSMDKTEDNELSFCSTVAEIADDVLQRNPSEDESTVRGTPPRPRSGSFTLETPSLALSERLASSAPPPGPDQPSLFQTPYKQTPECLPRNSRLSFSPVISQRVTQMLTELNQRNFTPESARAHLHQIQDMEQLLKDYHQLQLEELRCRQEEELKNLEEQKLCLEKIMAPEKSDSPPSQSSSSQKSVSSVLAPKVFQSEAMLRQKSFRPVPSPLETYLPGLVKGYLVRRILDTHHMTKIMDTIKETKEQLRILIGDTKKTDSDLQLYSMLSGQLSSALWKVHQIFFEWSPEERMGLLRRQRYLDRTAALRRMETGEGGKPKVKSWSSATLKSLARKASQSENASPGSGDRTRLKSTPSRKRASPSSLQAAGIRRVRSSPRKASPLSRRTSAVVGRTLHVMPWR